jgi:hypothetical protein
MTDHKLRILSCTKLFGKRKAKYNPCIAFWKRKLRVNSKVCIYFRNFVYFIHPFDLFLLIKGWVLKS